MNTTKGDEQVNTKTHNMHTNARAFHLKRTLAACLLAGLVTAVNASGQAASGLTGAISIKSQEGVVDVPIKEVKYEVKWMAEPIRVDGDKSDWVKSGAKPVRLAGEGYASWFFGDYGGEKDFASEVWLGRDYDNFYIGVEMWDDKAPAPARIDVAFTHADVPLIVGWQDVGMRIKPDDLFMGFVIAPDGKVGVHMTHLQKRMDYKVVQDSYGSEEERRAVTEQHGPRDLSSFKIFAYSAREAKDDGSSRTFVEIAIPWKSLLPHDPVKGDPIKMNIGMHDVDGDGTNAARGSLAWLPGLIGTYSGAHFPTLVFEEPKGRKGVDIFAQTGSYHYLNKEIGATVSMRNQGAAGKAKLQILEASGNGEPLTEKDIDLPAGYSQAGIAVHSEKVGKQLVSLVGRLVPEGGETVTFPIFVPRADNTITIQPVEEISATIKKLEKNLSSFSNLYARVEAAGLDTAYPKAYLTMLEMFLGTTRGHFSSGLSDRVLANTAHLEEVYARGAAYMNAILKDPSKQLTVPSFNPEKLKIKDGYWYDGKRPVFLWGPCTFWFMESDTPYVVALGNNSVCPEVPRDEKQRDKAIAHMEYWRTNGVHVNVNISGPRDLSFTGADVRASKLLQEHPEMKNNDGNNFLSFVVQHPLVAGLVDKAYKEQVDFWKKFPGVNSYWLWNEPWYTNYSEMTRVDFANAMKKKYKNIEKLNQRWKTNYKAFEDIQLQTWPDHANYAPWYDFQMFRDDILVDFFSMLHKTAKKYNRRMPAHTKFMAASLHSFNMERLQNIYDIAGHDGSAGDRDIAFLDFCRSLYPEKPLSNTEVHIGYGGKAVVDYQVWRLALHGLANGNWWCWTSNFNFSDSIGNAQSMDALTFSGLDIQRLMVPHMHSLVMRDKPVATLFPDVVERRSDISMVRLRSELAGPHFMLGLQPFYATESRISKGELKNHKILLAGESNYLKDSTYAAILKWVKGGGMLITTKGGFATNEYGDKRDASELVISEGGEVYVEGARIYEVGKGKVICIDQIESLYEPVLDGGTVLRDSMLDSGPRRHAYYKVLEKYIEDNKIDDAVRLVPSDVAKDDPNALVGFDWGVVEIDGAYTLCIIPYGAKDKLGAVKLETKRPIAKITNLITGAEVPAKKFKLDPGRNMFSIELQPEP